MTKLGSNVPTHCKKCFTEYNEDFCTDTNCECHIFRRGYDAALDDLERAMKSSEATTLGPAGMVSFNDPSLWVPELRKMYKRRFFAI